jgi:hypothetical protein
MNEITVKQLLGVIGDLRVQLFDDDSNLLLADGRKGSNKIQKYNDYLVGFVYFRKSSQICIRIYKED